MLKKAALLIICLLAILTLTRAQNGLGDVISYSEYGGNISISPVSPSMRITFVLQLTTD